MNRSRTPVLLGAAALSLALTTATALPAWASSGPESTTDGATTTIKVLEKETGGQFIPKGEAPQDFPEDEDFRPSPGDAFTFTSDLMQGDEKVGTDVGTCTFIDLDANTNHCKVKVTFANGTISVDSVADFPEDDSPFQVTIVSGTGAYAGAKGTATVTPAEDEGESNLALVFTTGSQVSEVPSGGAAAGGGLGDSSDTTGLLALGALVGLTGLGVLVGGRRLAATRR
ncbi:hypothetical protein [Sporichthya sp.]|uniref:allene oxide cyclase barrel-like domain-containing protein n=1 Tax=Sporichthya sp. TaxID=65475 RepID=UPI0017AA3D24|nr:hypothetical protein [Sporichthya sp.]MBA3744056.1 hypothetical protein [Sporichthya sp.]